MKANAEIIGISATVPEQKIDLSTYEAVFGKKMVRRIKLATGIHCVRAAPNHICASDMGYDAAERLLTEMEFDRNRIGALVFVSQSPDYLLPATSCVLQHRLNLKTSVYTLDIPYGCSGFTYGVAQSAMIIQSGIADFVLVIAGDTIERKVNVRDRASRMLFGDGSAAALVSRSDQSCFGLFHTDGSGANAIIIPAGGARIPVSAETGLDEEDEDGNWRSRNNLYMNGGEVTKFAIDVVPQMIENLLAGIGWSSDEVDCVLLHQASVLLIRNILKRAGLPEEKAPVCLKNYGNTSAASIPLAFIEEFRGRPAKPEKTIAVGFGVGLSCAGLAMNMSHVHVAGINEIA